MKIIGLTGGIGVGKSTVSDYLRKKDIKIIDADDMARKMTAKGSETLQMIAEAFGQDMILPDGNLDRKKLASVVFSDTEKAVLEELTTKKVAEDIFSMVCTLRKEDTENIAFIDAPLLFECDMDRLCDAVWLVYADEESRITRVMERDGVLRGQVADRINNQMSEEEKRKKSTDIIDNSGGKEELYRQIDALLKKY